MKTVKLGELCDINPKDAQPAKGTLVSFIPMQRVSETGLVDTTETRQSEEVVKGFSSFREGDILMAKITPCMENGKGGIAKGLCNGIGYGSTEFHVIRPTSPLIRTEWIYYYTTYPRFRKLCEQNMTGSAGQKRVPKSYLLGCPIPVPDLNTQDKVIHSLRSLRSIIELRNSQLAKLDELVKCRFIEMFGDPVTNPKQFPCFMLGEIVKFQGGSQPDKKHFEYESSPHNIRLLQIRDYKSDRFVTYIPKALAKRFCSADDIMIGRYGPPIFQILGGIEGAYNVALMKAIPQRGNKEFIRQFLKQDCLLKYLEGLSKRTAGQDGIQMDKLKSYPFPYPPDKLQDAFAAFVSRIDKLRFSIQSSLEKTQQLFDSLMQEYFD